MIQTRGKRTLALKHGGGAVRRIEVTAVKAALANHGLPSNDELVTSFAEHLNRRLISLDAAPKVLRGSERQLQEIENAAKKLQTALKSYVDWKELSHAIQSDIRQNSGYVSKVLELYRWLQRMADARGQYFVVYNPTSGYHDTIHWLLGEIKKQTGTKPTVSGTSPFFHFLADMEQTADGLIFPKGTVQSGRFRYVQNALRAVNNQIAPE
jgi:hypothetical protein